MTAFGTFHCAEVVPVNPCVVFTTLSCTVGCERTAALTRTSTFGIV